MKFLSVALAALLGMAEGKRSITAKQLKTRMEKGQLNKSTLMAGAKPYSDAARKLEDEEQEWEINGLYSIQFNSCLSMTVQDDDLFDEAFINYAQDGQIIAEKSYILFSVCYSSDCYYQAENEKMTFITDIATYFQAFADFLPNQVEQYCEGCQENYDYCSGALYEEMQEQAQEEAEQEEEAEEEGEEEGEEGEEGEGEEGEGEEGGERKLAQLPFRRLANNRVVQMIDCDMCDAYECFDEEEEEQQQGDDAQEVYEFEQALEWLDDMSQCAEIENAYDAYGNGLFAGLICNAEGNGVEIGVFYDEECSMYTPSLSYANYMSYADSQYFSMSEEVVEYMFMNDFSCYQPEVQYTNPYQYEEEEEEQNDDEEYQAPEAAEWCGNLFNGNMEAVNMYDCGADQEEGDDNAQEEEEYDENLYYYEWYSYQLTEEQANEPAEVCEAIKGLNGEYSTVYDKKNGGTLYNYKKSWGSNKDGSGMGAGGVVAIIVILLVVAGAAAAMVFKGDKSSDKKAPLINNADGTMA